MIKHEFWLDEPFPLDMTAATVIVNLRERKVRCCKDKECKVCEGSGFSYIASILNASTGDTSE